MKDVKAILEQFEIDDDAKAEIIKQVNENYRTVEEMEKKRSRIEELETQNATLTEQVGNLEGDGEELEKLRQQVQDFTEADERRKEEEAENAARDSFRAVFDKAVGDREFSNDIMRETIFEKTYNQCKTDTGLGADKVIESLTKDKEGVWLNPQHSVHQMPSPEDMSSGGKLDQQKVKDSKTIVDFLYPKK